jgi:hypothetical protein
MLCSKCRDPIRPVVVLDIDGTLGAYHSHFHHFAQEYMGSKLALDYDGSCELHEWYDMDLQLYRDIKLAYRQGGMKRSMPVIYGAKDLVDAVHGAGAETWICTTRPYLRLDNIDPDTREWLARHRIGYDGLLYSESKYQRLLEIVDKKRIVAVLDDLPEMCEIAAKGIGKDVPLLAKAPHNSHYRMVQRERSSEKGQFYPIPWPPDLPAAQGAILHKIEEWKELHGRS